MFGYWCLCDLVGHACCVPCLIGWKRHQNFCQERLDWRWSSTAEQSQACWSQKGSVHATVLWVNSCSCDMIYSWILLHSEVPKHIQTHHFQLNLPSAMLQLHTATTVLCHIFYDACVVKNKCGKKTTPNVTSLLANTPHGSQPTSARGDLYSQKKRKVTQLVLGPCTRNIYQHLFLLLDL